MSYYIVEKDRIILSGNTDTLMVEKDCCDIEYFEIEPEDIFQLLKIRKTIYNLDWNYNLFTDGNACEGEHLIESDDRPVILNFTEGTLYDPFFVFTAINGKQYYVQDIYLCDFQLYRVLNFTKEELHTIWLSVEKGQIFDDLINDALFRYTYDVEEEIALSRITDVPPDGAIHIDDEFFEHLESGEYQKFLEEVLEIDLIQEITNPKAA
ncbi:hypothetical protein ACRRS0_11895 [Agarivorans sp. QJM3NY_29]|uniref:hypothetical protein n=1 Tax=unclassified Agarivorans TaxID=2636026 RepID=UPI003D7C9266